MHFELKCTLWKVIQSHTKSCYLRLSFCHFCCYWWQKNNSLLEACHVLLSHFLILCPCVLCHSHCGFRTASHFWLTSDSLDPGQSWGSEVEVEGLNAQAASGHVFVCGWCMHAVQMHGKVSHDVCVCVDHATLLCFLIPPVRIN